MKRYQDQFSPWDVKGIADSYRHVFYSLVDDLVNMGVDELISDYVEEKNKEEMNKQGRLYLEKEKNVILSMWSRDEYIGIRFISGPGDYIRFATPDEMLRKTGDSVDVYIPLTVLEEFYKSHGYTTGPSMNSLY
jgi:hypothetical protein